MKSSDDELNDAIKNVLKGSLGNFERKPMASLDELIYRELGQKPNRKPLWAVLCLVALIGSLVLFVNDRKHSVVTAKTKPVTGNVAQKTLPDREKDKVDWRGKGVNIAPKTSLKLSADRQILSDSRITAPQTAEVEFENQAKPKRFESSILKPNAETENREDYIKDDAVMARNPDSVANAFHIEKLDFLEASKFPKLALPLIMLMFQGKTDSVAREIADKKPVGSWKPAMLVNVSATNTSQSVYLLPSTNSRILKVSFPNSIGNIGYRLGFGMEAKGYQLLINYCHLQYQTEYVYASDEFAAEPVDASYQFKRLGTARTVKSAFDMVGVAAKKNVDFETKALGALYAQLGMEYSHSVTGPGQQLLSASVSAGKRMFAGPKATIFIGPFFEYNILRIPTLEENVKIRPNQVGISLGLKFAN